MRCKGAVALFMMWAMVSHAHFQQGVDQLINQVSPSLNVGVEVFDLTTGSMLYHRNPNRPYVPASNMKLFSDAAVLMVLGPDYRFHNQLSTGASSLQQGVLKGSLHLHLSGDPSFNRDRLANLLAGLKSWKIRQIKGHFYIDSSLALVDPYPTGWAEEDFIYSYGAPIAPLMIDANRLNVTINPANQVNGAAIIETNDASHSITIENQVQTKASDASCRVSFLMDLDNHLTIGGCVTLGQRALQEEIAIRNPLKYAQGLIRHQLEDANIKLDGEILLSKAPPPSGSLVIAAEFSKPIAQLMGDTLKPSDNLYADSLYLHAAQTLVGSPVNWKDAQRVIQTFLQEQTGIDLSQAQLMDGSGLSRNDRLTPNQTVNLLRFIYSRFPLSYEYIAALPISGRDGTLQRRLKNPTQQDLVRAKTGTMRGIASLSGYLYTVNAHTLAFAIYINHAPGVKASISERSRYLVDAICNYFLQQKPEASSVIPMISPLTRLKYQQNPTSAQLQRKKQAQWRGLETVVKEAFKNQAVTILYRDHELILQDNQKDMKQVWHILQTLIKKYPFAVAMIAKSIPMKMGNKPLVLWVESSEVSHPPTYQRIWTIRESI